MENNKIGYVFDKINKEFIGTEIVYLEKRTGDYPHADNVVFIAPPEIKEHQKQIWTGKDWKIIPDFRGKRWFRKDGSVGGIIDFLGELNDEILEEPPRHEPAEKVKYNYKDKKWVVELQEGFIRDSGTNLIREKTKEELYDEGKMTLEEYNEYIRQERQMRFMTETDKMGLMYLRGECTLEEWKSAMDKIREELPKK